MGIHIDNQYRENNEKFINGEEIFAPGLPVGSGCAVMKEHGIYPSTLADVTDAPILLMQKFISEGSDPDVYNEVLNSLSSEPRNLLFAFEMLFSTEVLSPEIALWYMLNSLQENRFPFSILSRFAYIEEEKLEKFLNNKDFNILTDAEKFCLSMVSFRYYFWLNRRPGQGIEGRYRGLDF
jgi:hypothetical protein